MAPIRDIQDKFDARYRAAYNPVAQLCVDEQLAVDRGRCPTVPVHNKYIAYQSNQ